MNTNLNVSLMENRPGRGVKGFNHCLLAMIHRVVFWGRLGLSCMVKKEEKQKPEALPIFLGKCNTF